MRVLLLTPPLVDLHTPYPATTYLTGFLRKHQIDAIQADAGIELALRLFSVKGLTRIREHLSSSSFASGSAKHFLQHADKYISVVETVIQVLQRKKDDSLAMQVLMPDFFPPSSRAGSAWARENAVAVYVLKRLLGLETFELLQQKNGINIPDPQAIIFGHLGLQERARYLATQYITDLVNIIKSSIDPAFDFSGFGEALAFGASSFEPIRSRLEAPPTLVDQVLGEFVEELLIKHKPDLVGVTVPFPGNAYGAFRIGKAVKQFAPKTAVALGGGFVNTEIRNLSDPRVFDYVDFITLDDGERPLMCLLEHIEGKRSRESLYRTLVRENGQVSLVTNKGEHDIPHRETGTPTYDGIPIKNYLSVIDVMDPIQLIWANGVWNKLTLAHGCYWKKCGFCDTSLDYIGRYDPASVELIVDRICAMKEETGNGGFHFVDEAAPPAILRALALKLIERKINIRWWGNMRFDKEFTPELTKLLADSGCVAVTGGLEVASDRLLKLMQKGVSLEQVARVTHAFSSVGIIVHAYLMYGFPTQTEQETIDSLEYVRQLFSLGCIRSAVWNRFMLTAFSPVGLNPKEYGLICKPKKTEGFSNYYLEFEDPTDADHHWLGLGLRASLKHFLHGSGFERDVTSWFPNRDGKKTMKTTVPKDFFEKILAPEKLKAAT